MRPDSTSYQHFYIVLPFALTDKPTATSTCHNGLFRGTHCEDFLKNRAMPWSPFPSAIEQSVVHNRLPVSSLSSSWLAQTYKKHPCHPVCHLLLKAFLLLIPLLQLPSLLCGSDILRGQYLPRLKGSFCHVDS